MVGSQVKVLFEKPGREAGQMVGKSEYLHAVHVADPGLAVGDLRRVLVGDQAEAELGAGRGRQHGLNGRSAG